MSLRALIPAALMLLGACARGGVTPTGESPAGSALSAQVASYELVAGAENRFLVGLLTQDNRLVVGGEVRLRFFFLGEDRATGREPSGAEVTAEFLRLPGEQADVPDVPSVVPPSRLRGVYRAEPVTFDRPGLWEVEVEADVAEAGVRTATAAFAVVAEAQYPAPGDPAPRTRNLTLRSDAPAEAVDSRAGIEGEIPDPELHRATVAGAIRAGRPAVVVLSTPVYCVSQFCGPVTDMVAGLEREYGHVAEFIHIEVWRDFQGQVINRSAAEWLFRGGDLTEPWVFLVGADGRIAARWDNVATREEIEPWLERLR